MFRCIAELSLRLLLVGLLWVAISTAPSPGAAHPPAPVMIQMKALAPAPAPPPACPDDMALVDGDYCSDVDEECLRPGVDHKGCDEYAAPTVCVGTQSHMRYCIDKYEYPNQSGVKPDIMKSWYDADKICRGESKRVCGSREWTLACEGPDRWPYPYGYVRDATACHIDEKGPMINEKVFYSVDKDKEIERIDRREPSGARERCVSPYGVYDLTGNVDEWSTNEAGVPDHGALKGGNWGLWRNACRPATTGHAAWFRYYQLGFRCCSDAKN
jgi:sulfatase modifying factor 1